MNKLIFITLLSLISLVYSQIQIGVWTRHNNAVCGTATSANVTYNQYGYQVFDTVRSHTTLQNITFDANGQSFSGFGALYNTVTGVFMNWTPVKGMTSGEFMFQGTYSASGSYAGSTDTYLLDQCSNTLYEEISHL